MKRKLLSAVIFVLLITFVMSVTAFKANAEEVTITGTVVALDFDDKDKVVAVSIDTADGYYDVSDNSIGKQLLTLLDKNVKVTGIVGEDKDGNRTITVKSYEIQSE
ncbi:MAG: hypothetical protein Q7J27_11095 [Syntrophales bacterium]|nr:hypothetical protein [Syntrophales bacterium]